MEPPDPLLERVSAALVVVPGLVAVALGGSRATGAAHASSDYDIGLYFSERATLDVQRLRDVVSSLVDEPTAAQVTDVGGWGPWIVGGGWLTIGAMKVDLLYRPIESVERVIGDCRKVASAWTISRAIRMGSAQQSGWARSRFAAHSAILRTLSLN